MSVSGVDRFRDVTGAGDAPPTRGVGLNPNFWYPLARSRDLRPGKTLETVFAGEPIVLVRPEKGEPYALEDRCAHRQVPLHLGVVKGDRLLCGYHCSWGRPASCPNSATPYPLVRGGCECAWTLAVDASARPNFPSP